MNKAERLLEAIGDVRDEYIDEAQSGPKARKSPWKSIAIAAACVCIVAAALFSGIFGSSAQAEEYIDIYYIDENSELSSKTFYMYPSADNILAQWSEINDVDNVYLVYMHGDIGHNFSNDHHSYSAMDEGTLFLKFRIKSDKYNDIDCSGLIDTLKKTLISYENKQDGCVTYTISGDVTAKRNTSFSVSFTLGVDVNRIVWTFIMPDGTVSNYETSYHNDN